MNAPVRIPPQQQGPLLPNNATPLERALEDASATRWPLPFDLVSAILDPARCPAHLLGYLAYHLSIDLWREDWPEAKKRSVCRRALTLHRLKTTVAGIRAHLELVDAELIDVVRPPSKPFLTGTITAADREAWLARLPQLRIYPVNERARALTGAIFPSGNRHRAFLSAAPPVASTGLADGADGAIGGTPIGAAGNPARRRFLLASRGRVLLARRATFIDPLIGEEVEAGYTIAPDGMVEQLAIRGKRGTAHFLGSGFIAGHLQASRADTRLLTVRLDVRARANAVPPGTRPAEVAPRRVRLTQPRQAGRTHTGRRQVRHHLLATRAPLLSFDRIAFAVPGRFERRVRATSFLGAMRLGQPAYTAELTVKIRQRRKAIVRPRFHGFGHLVPTNTEKLRDALEAIRVSKALRDRILVNTTTVAPVRFNPALTFDGFTFGELRKAA